MRSFSLALVLVLLSGDLRAEVKVSLKDGRMNILATRASVKEILDRVASVTGMKVIYDGPVPAKTVTKSVTNRTPADAILGILEGEGINFAVILNPTGTQVETLLVTGSSKARPAPPLPAGQPSGPEGDGLVEVDAPPPPPPADQGTPAPPPADPAGQPTATGTPTPFPTPSPQPSSPFTPQGPGPILMPPPIGTPMPR